MALVDNRLFLGLPEDAGNRETFKRLEYLDDLLHDLSFSNHILEKIRSTRNGPKDGEEISQEKSEKDSSDGPQNKGPEPITASREGTLPCGCLPGQPHKYIYPEGEGPVQCESYPDPRWMNEPRKHIHLRDHRYKYIYKIINKLRDSEDLSKQVKEYQDTLEGNKGNWESLNQHIYPNHKDYVPPSVNALEFVVELILQHGAATKNDRNKEPSISGCFLRFIGKLFLNRQLAEQIAFELTQNITNRSGCEYNTGYRYPGPLATANLGSGQPQVANTSLVDQIPKSDQEGQIPRVGQSGLAKPIISPTVSKSSTGGIETSSTGTVPEGGALECAISGSESNLVSSADKSHDSPKNSNNEEDLSKIRCAYFVLQLLSLRKIAERSRTRSPSTSFTLSHEGSSTENDESSSDRTNSGAFVDDNSAIVDNQDTFCTSKANSTLNRNETHKRKSDSNGNSDGEDDDPRPPPKRTKRMA